ncbi:hypothetical protein GF407_01060 [candidate division KSB1 bacterium]|nr:hypothetical protein [candidate division KSB1 bacterium]
MTIPGKKVPVDKIEKHLHEIWEQKASELKQDLVRSSTINFCVTCELSLLDKILELLHHVVPYHPGRVVVAAFDEHNTSEQITAHVYTYCHEKADQKRICSEMIILHFGKNSRQHLTGLILPLILPNLPLYLWWMLSCDQLMDYDSLLKSTNRLIVNSPFLRAVDMETLVETVLSVEEIKLSDYAWGRITNWREAMAHYIDPDSLQHIQQVTLFSSGENPALDAWLFVGWLASRLSWTPKGILSGRLTFSHKDQRIDVLFENKERDNQHLLAVEIKVGPDQLLFRSQQNSIQILKNDQFLASIPLTTDPGQILSNELDVLFQDRIYLQALEKLSELFHFKKGIRKDEEQHHTY